MFDLIVSIWKEVRKYEDVWKNSIVWRRSSHVVQHFGDVYSHAGLWNRIILFPSTAFVPTDVFVYGSRWSLGEEEIGTYSLAIDATHGHCRETG